MAKADIGAVKAAHPILDVLRDLGIPVHHGRIRCLRPGNHAHGDRTPSVSIWPDKGAFKCWVCPDVKGDVIDLVRLARNCSFKEALAFLGGAPAMGGAPAPAPGTMGSRPAPGSATGPRTDPRIDYVKPIHSLYNPAPDAPPGPVRPSPSSAPAPASSASLAPTSSASHSSPAPGRQATAPSPASPPRTPPLAPVPSLASAPPPAPPPPPVPARPAQVTPALRSEAEEAEEEALRQRMLAALLEACAPVGGAAGRYLAKRRIFRRTWEAQRLRMIDDYAGVGRKLEAAFGLDALARMGFFNAAGHLRFYRHVLLFPYYDITGRAVYLQARAIDPGPVGPRGPMPKELSLAGHIPLPYNARLLDGEPGQVYLCEGVIDTLTLLEQGFPAVGVPGAANFKAAWAPLFRNKTVHVAFDPDGPGESGAAKAIERLKAMGVEARRLAPPPGKDLNDWFRKG